MLLLTLLLCAAVVSNAFNMHVRMSRSIVTCSGAITKMSGNDMTPVTSRQRVVQTFVDKLRSVAVSSAAVYAATATKITTSPAFAGALQEANVKLGAYGIAPIIFVPPNFSPLVSEYGRGSIKEQMKNPIIVQFSHPSLWIEAKTSVNNNGEAGTISANDYVKGDSAFLFVRPLEKGQTLSETSQDIINTFVAKSLSQKGDPIDQMKIGKIRKGATDPSTGQQYFLVDISYQLNTEAGFLIGRKGVVAVTSVGPQVQGLVSVTTDKRYKNLESTIRDIADSFRVYKLNSGIYATGNSDE